MYADSGHRSTEINLLNAIDRFGVMAIMGRSILYAKEVGHFIMAEKIVRSYKARKNSESWAAWANENPQDATLLFSAEKMLEDNNG